ncbi:MAG: hypothetical protein IJU62_10315 [Muribaculaceae bacterium]|nr:hypothetical protein [Muribaculaceae bacterium]
MRHVIWLTLVVLAAIVAMSLLPEGITVGTYKVLPAHALDGLCDAVLRPDQGQALQDGQSQQQDTPPSGGGGGGLDTCRAGLTCIEDFAWGESVPRGMAPLYDALARRRALGRPVRIAVLGDSYIQGDIFTAPLRALLQQHYGGSGVGMVPVSNHGSNRFRRSVSHEFGTWEEHLANKRSGYDALHYGAITSSYFTLPEGGSSWVSLQGVTQYACLDTCYSSQLLYYAPTAAASASATATLDGGATLRYTLGGEAGFGSVTASGKMGRVRWDISGARGGIAFMGASMDPQPGGVSLDNFAMESLSGYQLGAVPQALLEGMDAARHYDLVVLMFGQNVASPSYKKASAYNGYINHMTRILDNLKQAMPGTGFLVVSIGDREVKRGGSYVTPDGIKLMIAAQRQVAMEAHVAFFNLYEAMGGEGSVVKLVEKGMANKDYTHINHRGGEELAPLLAEAIFWGEQHFK